MRSDGTHVCSNHSDRHAVGNTDTRRHHARRQPPTAEDLARLDAQTKTALDSILTGTTQSRTSLEREFPALSKAAAPFKTFDEPDHVAGEKLSFLEAEKAIKARQG